MEKQDLITYITKLNDRNIQRQKATGFSLWAIVGAILYVSSKIIDDAIFITNDSILKNWFIPILASVLDSAYCITLLFLALFILIIKQTQRYVRPNLEISFNPIINIAINLSFILYAFLNYYTAINSKQYNFSRGIFLSFTIFFAFSVGYSMINALKNFIGRIFFKTYRFPIKELQIWPRYQLLGLSISYLVLGIGGIFLIFLNYLTISMPLRPEKIKPLIMISAEIFIINFLIIVLIFQIKEWGKNAWLEGLEKDIYLNEFSVEEIKEKLESEIVGSNPLNWIRRQKDKKIEILNTFIKGLSNYESELIGFKSSNKKEIKLIVNRYERMIKNYKNIHQEIFSKLWALINIPLTKEEKDEWHSFLDSIKTIQDEIIKTFKKIKERINAITRV